MANKVLVTGGTGCIGAAAVYELLQRGADEVVIATRSSNPGLLQLWFGDQIPQQIQLVKGDVGDETSLQQLIRGHRPTHIIHLGAFQSPDCDKYPERGMMINTGGTLQLFRAAEELGDSLKRFVFASSGAVYGKRALYPGKTVLETDSLYPPNLYGIWKLAGEHLARLFHERSGVPTVCLRLNTTYGKGRDRGTTSAPTNALKSIAIGKSQGKTIPFRMPYQGRENYHFVQDVGAHFAATAMQPFTGFGAFNIRGQTHEVSHFLEVARKVAAELGLSDFTDIDVAADAKPNLFICDLDDNAIQAKFEKLPRASLEDGIRQSLNDFQAMAAQGLLELPG
jgi:nucleoside-diphosphate-sugar epimerase